jgi:hypothetical protein
MNPTHTPQRKSINHPNGVKNGSFIVTTPLLQNPQILPHITPTQQAL